MENLKATDKLYDVMRAAAEVVGQIALRLTHDHELYLDFERYSEELLAFQEKFFPYDRDVKVRKALSALNPCLWGHVLIRLCCHWMQQGGHLPPLGTRVYQDVRGIDVLYRAVQAESLCKTDLANLAAVSS